jgi:hypothetical protein
LFSSSADRTKNYFRQHSISVWNSFSFCL